MEVHLLIKKAALQRRAIFARRAQAGEAALHRVGALDPRIDQRGQDQGAGEDRERDQVRGEAGLRRDRGGVEQRPDDEGHADREHGVEDEEDLCLAHRGLGVAEQMLELLVARCHALDVRAESGER